MQGLFMEAFKEPLTKEEEEFWILKHRAGEPQAKDILIERNLRLVGGGKGNWAQNKPCVRVWPYAWLYMSPSHGGSC